LNWCNRLLLPSKEEEEGAVAVEYLLQHFPGVVSVQLAVASWSSHAA